MKKTAFVAVLFITCFLNALAAQENSSSPLVDASGFVRLVQSRTGFAISPTEVDQALYETVTGTNPSFFKDPSLPVESVSYYDAIVFCNLLSMAAGVEPVYSVDGITDPAAWNSLESGEWDGLKMSPVATGYRLPTKDEWLFASRDGQEKSSKTYVVEGSPEDSAWFDRNSGGTTHQSAQKAASQLGLYDMNGNVWEWCWDGASPKRPNRFIMGGGYDTSINGTMLSNCITETLPIEKKSNLGFRLVYNLTDDQIKEEQKKAEHEASAKSIPPLVKSGKSQYPVSWWLWNRVMPESAVHDADDYAPAYGMNYYQAVVFCNRLSTLCGKTPVYELNKSRDPESWGPIPSLPDKKWDKIKAVKGADGYSLEGDAKKFSAKAGSGFYVLLLN